jgi:lipoprotein-anchoring transpeptidase ErfK/SrfK
LTSEAVARRTSKAKSNPEHGPGRWLLFAVLIAAIVGGLWWRWKSPPSPPPKPVPNPSPTVVEPTLRLPPTNFITAPTPPPRTNPPVVVTRPITNPPPARPPVTNVGVAPAVTNLPPPAETWTPRSVTNILEAQIALTWHGISCGPIDGKGGGQTELGLKAFQLLKHLEQSGRLDRDTLAELRLERPRTVRRVLAEADFARLQPTPDTWLGKSQAVHLEHESLLERLAERSQAHPDLLRQLNPAVNWQTVTAGTEIVLPNAGYPTARRANLVRVNLTQKWIRAFDANGRLLAHFPCSIGKIADKRPVGELSVAVAVKDPNYTFNPEVFPESEEGRKLGRKLVVPPGPNNPVGVAWIGLSKPGYGIHGTPVPEKVGRTESHGCFRLANWNADYLRQMVRVGTPVWIE